MSEHYGTNKPIMRNESEEGI